MRCIAGNKSIGNGNISIWVGWQLYKSYKCLTSEMLYRRKTRHTAECIYVGVCISSTSRVGIWLRSQTAFIWLWEEIHKIQQGGMICKSLNFWCRTGAVLRAVRSFSQIHIIRAISRFYDYLKVLACQIKTSESMHLLY